jgi:hypothetical protein
MKAERRHELQQNTLAGFMENLPLYFRFHLDKILLGLLIVLAVVMLVRYRINSAAQSKQAVTGSLRAARDGIDELQGLDLRLQLGVPEIANRRRTLASQVSAAVETILRDTDEQKDARLRAESLVARADLNWALANLPPLPGAATQPALQLSQTNAELLQLAEDAYQQVLKQYPDQTLAATSAMLGLAAIAENRGQWDVARAQYAAVLQKPEISQTYKAVAQFRLQVLPRLQEPVFTGTVTTQPTTQSSVQPFSSTSEPTTQPATAPAP